MAAGVGILWKFHLDINGQGKSFPESLWIAEATEAEAKTAAIEIATQRKLLLPTDCEIAFAKISKNDSIRDSRYVPGAIGAGTYQDPGSPATDAVTDYEKTAVLVRLENDNGTSVSRKFACVPDKVVESSHLVSTIGNVTSRTTSLPAVSGGSDTWYVKFNRFLQLLTLYCSHVDSRHLPGGPYTYYRYSAAYPLRIAAKKGARLFA